MEEQRRNHHTKNGILEAAEASETEESKGKQEFHHDFQPRCHAQQIRDYVRHVLQQSGSASSSSQTSKSIAKEEEAAGATTEETGGLDVFPCIEVLPVGTRLGNGERRASIPFKPKSRINLYQLLKNSIGRELTRIPMPVNFNEPLSLLQRITEDYNQSALLDQAADLDASECDSLQQMCLVAAFAITAYWPTASRLGKPFNPLLGETYECYRLVELGWRSIAEQVSHHPPVSVIHCDSLRDWTSWQQICANSKFHGNKISISPTGISHVAFKKSGCHYYWNKINTDVHNIVIGKLWIENHGQMLITNTTNGQQCHVTFHPESITSLQLDRKIDAVIKDRYGNQLEIISGRWDELLLLGMQNKKRSSPHESSMLRSNNVLWSKATSVQMPVDSSKMYNMNQLAITLNEEDDLIAPTDSRLRPDIRQMELGDFEAANSIKTQLEEKQRNCAIVQAAEASSSTQVFASSKKNKQAPNKSSLSSSHIAQSELSSNRYTNSKISTSYQPVWFEKTWDPVLNSYIFTTNGRYWQVKKTMVERSWNDADKTMKFSTEKLRANEWNDRCRQIFL